MTETWPSGVPYKPLNNNVQLDPYRQPLATEFEGGNRRQRRSVTKNVATVNFTLRMSYTAFAIFKPWIRDDLVDGTLSFEMPIWIGGSYATRTCSFATPPRAINMQTDTTDIAVTIDVDDF